MEKSGSNCTTPSSLRPPSPGLFDNFGEDDDAFDLSLVASPGSKRCPTFKDYAEKIKRLQQENFQLRVRIYLSEQKSGVKTSSSDLEVLYKQLHTYHNPGGSAFSTSAHSIGPSSIASTVDVGSVNHELEKAKTDREQLEGKLRVCEDMLAEKEQQIVDLNLKNVELTKKNSDITLDLEIANGTIQKLSEKAAGDQTNEDEVEKLARFAFGQSDDVDAEWEEKLAEKSKIIKELERELEYARKKLESVGGYKSKLKAYETQITQMSDSLKDMGRKYVRLERQNEKLQKKMADKINDNVESDNSSSDKYCAVQKLVGMLQSRMKELTNFVETLLQLESRKVFTLTGLSDENRENLLKSVDQCRMLSKSLDKVFSKSSSSHFSSPANSFNFIREPSDAPLSPGRHRHHSSSESSYRCPMSPMEKVRLKTSEVQCNILEPSLVNSFECAEAYITRLKRDLTTLESINSQLRNEKIDLVSQVKALESNINVLRTANHPDKSQSFTGTKLKEENKKLLNRLNVTEEALRNLHNQHAKLVGELKTLRSIHQKSSTASIGSTVAKTARPSDSTSPDLGIDSGHDGALNSDDSNANTTNYREENRILRTTNRELALKLKQTRLALDNTLDKLNSTTKEKEQVEKAICRQLHKTHTILRQAKKSVEKFTNAQCQENINPSSSP